MEKNNFRLGIFLNKNLLGYGYRKQTTFLGLSKASPPSKISLKIQKYQHLFLIMSDIVYARYDM